MGDVELLAHKSAIGRSIKQAVISKIEEAHLFSRPWELEALIREDGSEIEDRVSMKKKYTEKDEQVLVAELAVLEQINHKPVLAESDIVEQEEREDE